MSTEMPNPWGERGYTSTYVMPDEFTSIRTRNPGSGSGTVSIDIGSVAIAVTAEVIDRLEQAVLDARTALASDLAASVSA